MYLLFLQAIFVISWSSGFIGAQLGTGDAEAVNLLFWRFLLVTGCLLPFVWFRLRTVTWGQVRYNAVIGFLAQFIYLISVYIAIRGGLPAGIAAVICALQPLITVALSTGGRSERSGLNEWVGLAIGFLGVAVVISGEYTLSQAGPHLGLYALPLLAAVTLSIATLYQRHQSMMATNHSRDGLVFPLFLQSATSLGLLAMVGAVGGSLSVPSAPQVWVAVVWLTVFSTFIAYLVLWQLLKMMSATRMSALVYLEPPVTLLWAAWMFGDTIQWTTYAGIVVIAVGIVIARHNWKPATCAQV